MSEYLGSAAALDHSVVLMLDGPGNGYYHTSEAGEEFEVADQFEFMGTIYEINQWPTGELVAVEIGYHTDDPYADSHEFSL